MILLADLRVTFAADHEIRRGAEHADWPMLSSVDATFRRSGPCLVNSAEIVAGHGLAQVSDPTGIGGQHGILERYS